jgi:hypothetical protein
MKTDSGTTHMLANSETGHSVTMPPLRQGIDRVDVALLLFLVVTFVGVALLPFAPKKYGDRVFHKEAKNFALAMRGDIPWSEFRITRAPAPVIYYGLPYLAVPPQSDEDTYWRAGFIWTTGWMGVCLLLIRRCGEILGGHLVGLGAALLTLLSPFSVYYSYGVLAEPSAYVGAAVMMYGFLRWKNHPRSWSHSIGEYCLLSLGLFWFVLSRPNTVILLAIAIAAAVALIRTGMSAARLEGKFVLASALTSAAMIALITLFLLGRSGGADQNPQNQNLVNVVMQGRFQFRSILWDFRIWPTIPDNPDVIAFQQKQDDLQRASVREGVPLSRLQWRWIAEDVVHNPGITLRASAIRLLCLHLALVHSLKAEKFRFAFLKGRSAYALFHVAVNAGTILILIGAVWFALRERRGFLNYWVLWGPWFALTVFHMATYAEARYLFPARPGLVVMASVLLVPQLQRLFSEHKRRRAGGTFTLVRNEPHVIGQTGLRETDSPTAS